MKWVVVLCVACVLFSIGASGDLWDPITAALDANTKIPNLVFIIGDNSSSDPLYLHTKGTASFTTGLSIASGSKWVSATNIMKLVEQGKMSLDDRPQKYIPWWTNSTNDLRSTITLRVLMAFTSGFLGDHECVGNTSYTPETCAQAIYDSNVTHVPNTTYEYGGSHFQIATLMAMKATNLTWSQILKANILDPLGIPSTTTLYTPPPNPNIAGGLFITPQNYMKIEQAIFLKQLVSPSTIEVMQYDETQHVAWGNNPTERLGTWHYGLGEWIECLGNAFVPSCYQNLTISSPGAFGFYPWIDRTNNYWGILSTSLQIQGPATVVPFTENLKPTILAIINTIRNNGTQSGSTSVAASTTSTSSATVGTTSTSAATASTSTSSAPPASTTSSASTTTVGSTSSSSSVPAGLSSTTSEVSSTSASTETSSSAQLVASCLSAVFMLLCL